MNFLLSHCPSVGRERPLSFDRLAALPTSRILWPLCRSCHCWRHRREEPADADDASRATVDPCGHPAPSRTLPLPLAAATPDPRLTPPHGEGHSPASPLSSDGDARAMQVGATVEALCPWRIPHADIPPSRSEPPQDERPRWMASEAFARRTRLGEPGRGDAPDRAAAQLRQGRHRTGAIVLEARSVCGHSAAGHHASDRRRAYL